MRQFKMLVGASAVLAGLACSDGILPIDPGGEPVVLVLPELLVSDAVPAVPGTVGAVAGNVGSGAVAFAFVSLPPGTLPQTVSVRIQNLTTGETSPAIPMVDGGFDPVPVAATEGDQLELSFSDAGNAVSLAYLTIPPRRPPRVVRTRPPRGRTDVALSVAPVVVFSEPVDPVTLPAGVRLLRDGVDVPARVAPVPGAPWSAELVPAASLEPETAYQLQATAAVRDLDGDLLEEVVTVEFRTGVLSPETATIIVSNVTTGGGFDLDNYEASVAVAGQPLGSAWLGLNQAVTFATPAGDATVTLSDVAANCEVRDGPSRTVRGVAGVVEVTFEVVCTPPPELAAIRLVFRRAVGICSLPPRCWDPAPLWVMNADGTEARQLTAGSTFEFGNAVSPDGARVAFFRWDPVSRGSQLYTVDMDGGGVTQVTAGPPLMALGPRYEPAWSSDGSRIAFSYHDGDGANADRIDDIAADGTDRRTLIDSAWGPAWSPDGSTIAFFRGEPYGDNDRELWVMGAAGGSPKPVTTIYENWWPRPPTWTPDGSAIRFHTLITLWTVKPDGSGLVSRTPFPPNRCSGAWSADGMTYAFVNAGFCDGWLGYDGDIYLARRDGTVWARVTAEGRIASLGLVP